MSQFDDEPEFDDDAVDATYGADEPDDTEVYEEDLVDDLDGEDEDLEVSDEDEEEDFPIDNDGDFDDDLSMLSRSLDVPDGAFFGMIHELGIDP